MFKVLGCKKSQNLRARVDPRQEAFNHILCQGWPHAGVTDMTAQVANKLAEIVMMMDDREVCCQSDEAKEQYQRVASQYE